MSKAILHLAAEVAANNKNSYQKFYLGAIAKRSDGVFVQSTNNTVWENRAPSGHAEARVLKKCGKNAILWVAQIKKDGRWGNSFPCVDCQTLIRNMNVRKVYFTLGPARYGVWFPMEEELAKVS